jgi:hypothetical protein
MDWYGLKIQQINKESYDFDMILKFKEVTGIKNTKDILTYIFEDS